MEISNQVAAYYDSNTEAFLKHGQGGTVFAIHRAVWGPGVRSREEAMQYVENLLTRLIKAKDIETVIDLGCGCGGSMITILEQAEGVTAAGTTISRVQYEIGKRLLKERQLPGSIRFGSYLDPGFYSESGLPGKKRRRPVLLYAIESFLHSPDTAEFFKRAGESTRPGDFLVLCDDFLDRPPESGRESRLLDEFRTGWRVSNLIDPGELKSIARRYGFMIEHNDDMTSMLELNRFRDILIRILNPMVKLFPRRPYSGNLIGGNALQILLTKGVLKYRYIILKRADLPREHFGGKEEKTSPSRS